MRNRIAVYICHCGSNIADHVDVEAVRDAIAGEEGVVLAKTTMFACSDSAQSEMIEDIRENDIDGMVVASCSPKLHLFTFRSVAERAGLNPYNYVQANIREQVSWAHSDKPEQATEKALQIVRMAVAKARLSAPLTPPSITSENVILVVGAGVAGMRAAIELADMGSKVYLIEKDHYVGGRAGQWGNLHVPGVKGEGLVKDLYEEVAGREGITLFTGTEVISSSGSVGSFELTLRRSPRYFNPKGIDTSGSEFTGKVRKAVEACPEELDDDYDFGLTARKAFRHSHPGQFPDLPSVDMQACTRCGKCAEILEGVDLEQEEQRVTVKAGAVILCTGFSPYQPQEGEFGYGEIENVISLQEFRRMMALSGSGGRLLFRGRPVNTISYIYCVGSRQLEGDNKYCSRYCCSAAIHTANLVREKFPGVRNFHFHRGIRSYGKLEELYEISCSEGDIYFQSRDDELPEVIKEDGETIVKIADILTSGRDIEVGADLVVLVTGMVPRDNSRLVDVLKVPVGRDRFFNEVHPKLKPVEVVIDGIYIAGACQSPRNINESMNSALSAAVKSNSLVSSGEIELEPTMAAVDRSLCGWCGECARACPFDAIVREQYEGKEVAAVNEANCKGCGMCLPVCPVNAIQLTGSSDAEIESMIEALIDLK
ncbi:MAG: 4Fe-4S dicluster domain-containing protein [Candidatus Latescibacteria bacterium]|nr:4Fe-4S dicluster domain-containing protein [bacterium]MBD3423248.1 4Fe-4S dicluster domain-containing protein [Candidatus Latescibacterota bacterium]